LPKKPLVAWQPLRIKVLLRAIVKTAATDFAGINKAFIASSLNHVSARGNGPL